MQNQARSHTLFTSESVSEGHPDKVADQISDAILDACLKEDPQARVACETLVSTGLVVIAGEISMQGKVNYSEVVRKVIKDIGYDDYACGFDYRSCGIVQTLKEQSPEIALGIMQGGAGDQGQMFGYACDETPELMPLPIMLAHRIIRRLHRLRKEKLLPYLRPDAKTQVTVEYDERNIPIRLHAVVLSTQHEEGIDQGRIVDDMKQLIQEVSPPGFIDNQTAFYINPIGRFVIGGPAGDCGLTGRKIMVDSYGGMGRHGGGCFSGKDPSKLDRTAAYAARYIAKNIVAAQLATHCEIQISYAIGIPHPISLRVETFNTGKVAEQSIVEAISQAFDLTPKGIAEMLDLRRPIYQQTAVGGHFGRHEKDFSWEKTDRVELLLNAIASLR